MLRVVCRSRSIRIGNAVVSRSTVPFQTTAAQSRLSFYLTNVNVWEVTRIGSPFDLTGFDGS